MKCPKCGIEMVRVKAGQWMCRNTKCPEHKKEEK